MSRVREYYFDRVTTIHHVLVMEVIASSLYRCHRFCYRVEVVIYYSSESNLHIIHTTEGIIYRRTYLLLEGDHKNVCLYPSPKRAPNVYL